MGSDSDSDDDYMHFACDKCHCEIPPGAVQWTIKRGAPIVTNSNAFCLCSKNECAEFYFVQTMDTPLPCLQRCAVCDDRPRDGYMVVGCMDPTLDYNVYGLVCRGCSHNTSASAWFTPHLKHKRAKCINEDKEDKRPTFLDRENQNLLTELTKAEHLVK